ncbi:hypothetical protein D3C75_602580 [compost metagenome]
MEVVGNEMPRTFSVQHLKLGLLELHYRVPLEALEIQQQRGILELRSAIRHRQLLPVTVFSAPYHCSPLSVYPLQTAVLVLNPAAELRIAGIAVTVNHPEFVVGLPPDHRGMPAVMAGQLLHNPRPVLLQRQAVIAAVSAHTRMIDLPVSKYRQYIRITRCQPARRRCCRRSDNHLHAIAVQQINRPVKPHKFKAPCYRLQPAPGKFGHPDHPDARFLH